MRTQPRRPSIESPVNATTPDPWRHRIRSAAHAALLACNIAFASVVAAQDQPTPRPADALAGAAAAPGETHRRAESTPPAAPAPTATLGSPGQRPTLPFDFDADGVPDTIRREMRLAEGELLYSRFVIVSGATGLDLDAFPAPEPNDLFGWLVATVGDLDGDSTPDLAVAAPRTHTGIPGDGVRGRVFILSGATHDTLLTIDGDWWGFSGLGLVVVDDQDADGVLDLLIGGMQRIVETEPGDGPAPDGDGALFGDPPTDEPVVYFHSTWSLHSLGAGAVLESGEGAPPTRFLLAGESLHSLWASGPIPGERLWLEGASGDLNADGVVDMQDLLRLVEALGDPERAAALSHYFQIGDLNADGAVNMSDLTALLAQYGRTAQDLARERAERAGSPTPRPAGSGAAPGSCTDEFGLLGGGCYVTCVDCPFDIGIPGSGGGPPCPLCPPNCPSCTPCDDCPDPVPDCTSQCECYPCSCDMDDNGTPDKNDDDDGDGILNKDDCDSSCFGGDECGCNPLNLIADVNNDGLIDSADDAEESQQSAMVVAIVNRGDADEDGVPDYADGFAAFGPDTEGGTGPNVFAQIHLNASQVCNFESAEIAFLYNAADPAQTTVEVVEVPDIESSYRRFSRGNGLLRIWRAGSNSARVIDDFIGHGQPMLGAELGPFATFYVEAVNGSATPETITVQLTSSAGNVSFDTIKVLPFDSQAGLSVSEINGYTIHTGSATGTNGKDIFIGSDGNDVINAGDGDDIIVAGDGDDVIYTGTGADVIFASEGVNTIYFTQTGVSRPAESRADAASADRVIDERDQPFTTEQVIRAYKLFYGENDPWLALFLQHGGRIESVEGDGNPLTEARWSCYENEAGLLKPVILLQFSLQSPFKAAPQLRKHILAACERALFSRCDLGFEIEGTLIDDLFAAALAQEHADSDELLEVYEQLRAAAFDNAVQATTAITNIYLSSIGIFSEGADIALTISDVASGNYSTAIAILPFIAAPMVNTTKVVLRTIDGTEIVRKVGQVVHHFPEGVSDVGWVVQRKIPIRSRTPNGGGEPVLIIGTGQWTNGDNGAAHAGRCEAIADQWAGQGGFEYVVMNRSLHTCTGLDTLEVFAGKRPDVFGVARGPDGGPVFFIREIQSPSQTPAHVRDNLEAIKQALEELGFSVDADWIRWPY